MTSSQKLSAGLAALKQKNYATAIAHLELVDPSAPHAVYEKAQAGLIKAYAQTGQVNRAIVLCQTLAQSSSPQARDWASQTLSDLSQQYSGKSEIRDEMGDETGFVPLDSMSGRSSGQHDTTGFVPLSKQTPESLSNPHRTPREVIRRSAALPIVNSSEVQPPEAQTSQAHSLEAQSLEAQTVVEPTRSEALVPQSSLPTTLPQPSTTWKNAARAQKWGSLGNVDRSTLWAVTVGTVLALIWMIRTLPMIMQDSLYWICFQLAAMTPLTMFVFWVTPASDPGVGVAIALLFLFAVSPWLLDKLLQQFYTLKSLQSSELESHSPEAVRLLKRVCNQRRQPLPQLGLLPTDAPLAMTYGYLPRNARIVVSQGLLNQLEDEEIAVIYAAELAHIAHWNFGVMSWVTLVAQIPYILYWQTSTWGDRQSDRVLQSLAVLVSAFSYGFYWICRLPGLWLSRMRLYHSDRTASELTGNPNALTRALLKVAMGTAQTIQRWEHTSFLLESFEPLMPVGYRSALTMGSLYLRQSAPLEWDRSNLYRRWLSLLNTHPPLGDRLQLLALYAKYWRLTPLDGQTQNQDAKAPSNSRRRFLLQAAPFVGSLGGVAIALILWLLGGLAARLNWLELSWLWGDRSVLLGSALLGFSTGMFIRINAYFPDIKRSNLLINPSLVDLLRPTTSLPVDSQPLRLQGKLLGRRGFANWLHQDLMLLTETGLIRLHHTSRWGFWGDLLPQKLRPPALMKYPVTVTGWFRRGATPWIDIDTIQGKGAFLQGQHPLWSTALAIASALVGAFIIFRGGA